MPVSTPIPQNESATAWLERRQNQLKITTTTRTASGQIIDWVPVESQGPEPVAYLPENLLQRGPRNVDPERKTQAAEVEQIEPGPAGHVPILRPDISKIPQNLSVEEVFTKRGGLRLNKQRPNKQPTDPNPAGYFHATTQKSETCYGCEAWYNVWDPRVDIPSSPGDDHSISQTWIQNYQRPQSHSVEAGLTVDHSLNGDSANHLFSYFTNNGYTRDGDNMGGYNRLHKGYVQTHPSIFPGIRINGSSTQGAGTQLEIGIKFQYSGGNWFLLFNNVENGPWIQLGYYPASLFAGGLANFGQWVSFGGEVYSALANPCTTQDDMGSGRKAADGWSHSCYQRNMRYGTNNAGALANFTGSAEVDTANNCPGSQYTIAPFLNSATTWASYQYFGGQAA